MKKFILFINLFFVYTLSYAGISVEPSIVNIYGEQNSVYEGSYEIKNTYDKTINLNITIENGNSFSQNKDIDVNKWLKFNKYKYTLKPNKPIKIPYKVIIDKDFVGSISGRINFSTEPKQDEIISISLSVPIYVTVLGTENINFSIKSLNLVNGSDSISYEMILKNDGNVHIRHSGTIEIYNNKNELLKNIEIPETVPTYCEQERKFNENIISKSELKKGTYVAVFKIKAFDKEVIKELKFKVKKDGTIKVK